MSFNVHIIVTEFVIYIFCTDQYIQTEMSDVCV